MKRAFTLIELLVVIAIIAILAAILFPVFAQAKDAAKNTALLSGVKQMGTGVLLYAGDADDLFPPTMASQPLIAGDYAWQDLSQPYMKNYQIVINPKRGNPSGAPADVEWKRLQHFGMPARAATSSFPATVTAGYYSGTHVTKPVRFDGISGFVNLAPTDPDWLQRIAAPSYSSSAIAEPSGTVMIAESGNWDNWFSLVSDGPDPLGVCYGWADNGNGNAAGGLTYAFTTTTRPEAGLSGLYTPNVCTVPRGRTTWVATDSSARNTDFRATFYNPVTTANSTTYSVIKALNPTGL